MAYFEGGFGTLQEIFQDLAQNSSAPPAHQMAMVFVDTAAYGQPGSPFHLAGARAGRASVPFDDLITLADSADTVVAAMVAAHRRSTPPDDSQSLRPVNTRQTRGSTGAHTGATGLAAMQAMSHQPARQKVTNGPQDSLAPEVLGQSVHARPERDDLAPVPGPDELLAARLATAPGLVRAGASCWDHARTPIHALSMESAYADPQLLRDLGARGARFAPNIGVEVIVGAETAGVPLAASISLTAELPFAFVRKPGIAVTRSTTRRFEGQM